MHITELIKKWSQKTSVRIAIAIVLTVSFISLFLSNKTEPASSPVASIPVVELITAQEFVGTQVLSLVGTARAFSEANVIAERAGRVVAVNVALGQKVGAGAVIGSIENASERASVLQAEGVYEAAQAAAAQTKFSVSEAETRVANATEVAISTARSAYTTANGIVVSNIDTFFSKPNSSLPGLRIGGKGYTMDLNKERVLYQDLLPAWKARVDSLTTKSDLYDELSYVKGNVERIITMVDTFLYIFDQQTTNEYDNDEMKFASLRTTLIATLSSLDAARNGLVNANDALARATASATGGDSSASDAQVKQALGALHSAQANLAKTVFRSPISGTVNSLSIRTGDFVTSFAPVATIANNAALEIVTYISDSERMLLSENDAVLINGTVAGKVTQIAPAVDSATGKTEVRIAAEGTDIVNGDTVRITKEFSDTVASTEAVVTVPLSAIKFEIENGFVFVVTEGVLKARPVTLGVVRGGTAEITAGITGTEPFVKDARGLQEGVSVEIIK